MTAVDWDTRDFPTAYPGLWNYYRSFSNQQAYIKANKGKNGWLMSGDVPLELKGVKINAIVFNSSVQVRYLDINFVIFLWRSTNMSIIESFNANIRYTDLRKVIIQ